MARGPHRLVFVLFALGAAYLFYLGLSAEGFDPDRAAQLGAGAAFVATAVLSFALKSYFES